MREVYFLILFESAINLFLFHFPFIAFPNSKHLLAPVALKEMLKFPTTSVYPALTRFISLKFTILFFQVVALSVKEELSTVLTLNSTVSDVVNTERNGLPIGDAKNCDAESNLNTRPSPNHSATSPTSLSLQLAVRITDKDDGVDNKNSENDDVLDPRRDDLQNCDISISPSGLIQTSSSTSYVYTKKSEISKNHFEETVRTREISSFYDISNSSTV